MKKVTKYVGNQITDQNDKVEKLITHFREQFDIEGQEENRENEDPLNAIKNMIAEDR